MVSSTFSGLMEQYPCLRPYLIRICHRFRKRGALTGVMKLGQDLDAQELEALQALFGLQTLSISGSDEVRISFDRFFRDMGTAAREDWIDELHRCLGLSRSDETHEKHCNRQAAKLVLERLRLAFPELGAVHRLLAGQVKAGGNGFRGYTLQGSFFKAAEVTRFLRQNSNIVTLSELGARFLNDSKALRNTGLSRLVGAWLQAMEQEEGGWPDSETTVWGRHHVVRDRLAVQVTVFGPLLYEKNGRVYDWVYKLWQAGEPATLSWANIAGIDRISAARDDWPGGGLITCENETPFARMIREDRTEVLLYTSGFPNEAVLSLYRLIAPQAGPRRHWGDSDLAGLRIAAMLHAVFPLRLWRCDLPSLERHRKCLIALSEQQQGRIEKFLLNHPDFLFAAELRFTLEHGWLEQESWLSGD